MDIFFKHAMAIGKTDLVQITPNTQTQWKPIKSETIHVATQIPCLAEKKTDHSKRKHTSNLSQHQILYLPLL